MNIHSGIAVAVVHRAACRTGPLALTKAKIMIHIAADRTPLTRRKLIIPCHGGKWRHFAAFRGKPGTTFDLIAHLSDTEIE